MVGGFVGGWEMGGECEAGSGCDDAGVGSMEGCNEH